jgi:hypothetical protein
MSAASVRTGKVRTLARLLSLEVAVVFSSPVTWATHPTRIYRFSIPSKPGQPHQTAPS